jgi:hypothetical protein
MDETLATATIDLSEGRTVRVFPAESKNREFDVERA